MARNPRLLAKYCRPRIHHAVKRERLFDLLDEALRRPVIWLAAPPGSGKSTLLSTYVEIRRIPALWFHVDPADSDPATFFQCLNEAALRLRSRKALVQPSPEAVRDLPSFSARYFRALFNRLPSGCLLVLDNLHDAELEVGLGIVLRHLIDALPDSCSLAISSRADPPPMLARHLASEQIVHIGWEVLRLDHDETRQIVAGRLGDVNTLSADLHRRTGGWAAGLTLMLERLRRRSLPAESVEAETREAVFHYFAGEIFDCATADERRILISTAFLPHFDADMAARISGSLQAGRLLERLHRGNLFTDRRLRPHPLYQYHALFHDFLRQQARNSLSAEEALAMTKCAADLLAERGAYEEALPRYLAAQETETALDLVAKAARNLVSAGRGKILRDWLAQLRPDSASERPWIGYWLGTSLNPVDPLAGREQLERTFQAFEANRDRTGQLLASAGILESYYFHFSSFVGMDPWISVLTRLLHDGVDVCEHADDELRVYSSLLCGLLYRQPGNPHIEDCLNRVIALLDRDIDANQRVRAGTVACLCLAAKGELNLFETVVGKVRPLVARAEVAVSNQVGWYIRLRLACDFAGPAYATDKAQAISQAQAIEAESTDPWVRLIVAHSHLNADALRGDLDSARARLEQIRRYRRPDHPLDDAILHNGEGHIAMLRGDHRSALEHHQMEAEASAAAGYFAWNLYARILVAAELAYCKEWQRLDHLLPAISQSLAGSYLKRMIGEPALISAYSKLKTGNEEALRTSLETAFKWTDQGGIANLRWYLPMLSEICTAALARGIATQRVAELIGRYGIPTPSLTEPCLNRVSVRTLGCVSVGEDARRFTTPERQAPRVFALLRFLVAAGANGDTRMNVAQTLWPEVEGDAALVALDTTLHRLRKRLGDSRAVILQAGVMQLNGDVCSVDAWRIMDVTHRSPESATGRDVSKELDAYRGDFVGDESWAVYFRERLRSRAVRWALSVGYARQKAGETLAALNAFERAIEIDPLAEPAYRALMTLHHSLGHSAEVARRYQQCRDAIEKTLGTPLSIETQRLHALLIEPLTQAMAHTRAT